MKNIWEIIYKLLALPYNILSQTLTADNGQYSSKKVSMFACLATALFMALYALFKYGFEIEVFKWLLLTGMGCSGLGILDKKLNDGEVAIPPDTTTTEVKVTTVENKTE